MSHELETFADGSAAFFSAREPGWHRLGTVTTECLTAAQVMTTAYLGGWNVRKEPLTTTIITDDGVDTLTVPDRYATIRDNPKTGHPQVLGVVGRDYTPVQNEECCQLLDLLVDESGAHFETAGSLYGGRNVFVTMRLPEAMTVAGTDRLDLYLVATTSHDGTAALRVDATPVRVVCANTQRAALRASKAHYAFRHTSGAKRHVAEAREALRLMWRYFTDFERQAEQMINEALTLAEFEKVCAQLWPTKPNPTKRAGANTARRQAALRSLFSDAPTQRPIAGTRWAGYQSIVEYLDWAAPAKNDTVRATRAVITSNASADTKRRAFELLSA